MPSAKSERDKAIDEAIDLCKKKAVLWRSRVGRVGYTLTQVETAYGVAIRLGAEISKLREVKDAVS